MARIRFKAILAGSQWRAASSAVIPGLALILLVLVLFAPAAQFEFTTFDDPQYITGNPMILEGLTWEGVREALGTVSYDYWIPVTWLSYMVDVEIFGTGPAGFHLTNIILHALNALLIFLLLWSITGHTWPSFLTSMLFAVHPLRVESVAWIAERKGLLAAFFLLLSLMAYVSYVRSRKSGWYITFLVIYALSLMSKPVAVTLPLLLIVLDYWPLNRFPPAGNRDKEPAGYGRLHVLEKIPVLLLASVFAILTFVTQTTARHSWDGNFTLLNNVGRGSLAAFIYLRDLVWPVGLGVRFYDLTGPAHSTILLIAAIFAMLVLTAIVTLAGSRLPPALPAGWYWYLICLAPVSGVIPVGMQWTADRFSYIPHIFLLAALVWIIYDRSKSLTAKRTILVLAILLAGSWSIVSWTQISYWKDAASLASRSVTIEPSSIDAGLFKAGAFGPTQVDESIEEYRRILTLEPMSGKAHYRLALALLKKGESEEALEHLLMTNRLIPDSPEPLLTLGDVLYDLNRLGEAIAAYREFLKIERDASLAAYGHNQVGLILRREGNHGASTQEFEQATLSEPENELYHFNLAVAMAALDERDGALFHYNEALRLDTDYHQARMNLAEQLMKWGQNETSIIHFKEIIRRLPGTSEEHFGRGRLAEIEGDLEAALIHYEKGLRARAVFPEVTTVLERSIKDLSGK